MRALALALALAVLLASGRRDRDLPAALWTDVKDAGKEGAAGAAFIGNKQQASAFDSIM